MRPVSGSIPLAKRPAGRHLARGPEAPRRHQRGRAEAGSPVPRRGRRARADQGMGPGRDLPEHLCDMGGSAVDTSSPMGRMMVTMLVGLRRIRAGPDRRAHPHGIGSEERARLPHGQRALRLEVGRQLARARPEGPGAQEALPPRAGAGRHRPGARAVGCGRGQAPGRHVQEEGEGVVAGDLR